MSRFSLEPRRWYSAEFMGEEFGPDVRSYSPIRVDSITPNGNRTFSLSFYHANYPEGVRDKTYRLRTIERNRHFLLARSLDHAPTRLILVYAVSSLWLRQHFGVAINEADDPESWLERNT